MAAETMSFEAASLPANRATSKRGSIPVPRSSYAMTPHWGMRCESGVAVPRPSRVGGLKPRFGRGCSGF